MQSLYRSDNREALAYAHKHYDRLKENVTFRMAYNQWLARHSSDPHDRAQASHVMPWSDMYCVLGDYYLRIRDAQAAEHAYLTVSHMVPGRLLPVYKLWKLHQTEGDTLRAVYYARKVVTQLVKVVNSFTINARREARAFLDRSP